MRHLSPATARALKAAGFPQPKQPERGQHWAAPNGLVWVLDKDCPNLMDNDQDAFGFVYLPTAEDIFCMLPYDVSARRADIGFNVRHDYHQQEFDIYSAETLIEALAAAYIAIHTTPAP